MCIEDLSISMREWQSLACASTGQMQTSAEVIWQFCTRGFWGVIESTLARSPTTFGVVTRPLLIGAHVGGLGERNLGR